MDELSSETFEIRLPGENKEFDNKQQFILNVIAERYGGVLPFKVVDAYPFKSPCTDTIGITVRGRILDETIDKRYLNLVIGDLCVKLHPVTKHEFRAVVVPHFPACVPLFVTLNGVTPISKIYQFEFVASPEDDARLLQGEVISLEMRLASSLGLDPNQVRVASTRPELVLRASLKKWLQEVKLDRARVALNIDDGQGVIHLCARLGYTWAIMLFHRWGLSLDLKDSNGWTALHWAAFMGWRGTALILSNLGADVFLKTEKPINRVPAGSKAKDVAIQFNQQVIARELATAESRLYSLH